MCANVDILSAVFFFNKDGAQLTDISKKRILC